MQKAQQRVKTNTAFACNLSINKQQNIKTKVRKSDILISENSGNENKQ